MPPEEKKEEKKFDVSPSLAILAAGVLIAGSIIFVNKFPAQPVSQVDITPSNNTNAVAVPPPSSKDHIIGSPDAPIVLIEYSDFQCPFCTMVYPTLKRIVAESGGQVAWVYRNFPLTSIHPQAKPAALAAECIAEELGNDAFWKFADTVFANQSKMSPTYYAEIASGLGANPATFQSCVSSGKFSSLVDGQALEAQMNGGQGTPYTVIYGKSGQFAVSGAQPYEQFTLVINALKARQ